MSAAPTRRAAPGRDLGLDALRGLCALAIVVFHVAGGVGFNAYGHLGMITMRLKVGVPVFFALSGFLIYRQLLNGRPREGYGRYALRRLMRIVPGYWVALLIIAWVPPFAEAGHALDVLDQQQPLVFFGFAQVFSPDTVSGGIPPAWSLTSELVFYALVPLIALLLAWVRGKAGRRGLAAELTMLGLGAAGCIAVSLLLGPQRAGHPNLMSTPVMTALWFVPGMAWAAVAALRPDITIGPRARVACGGGAAALFALLCWQIPQRPSEVYEPGSALLEYVGSGVIAALLLVGFVGLRPQGLRRWLLRPVAYVGTISFGLYLWHVPIMVVARYRGDHAWMAGHAFLPLLAWVLPLSLAAGAVSWYAIERPLLRLAGRRLPRMPLVARPRRVAATATSS